MINRQALLADIQGLLKHIEADLLDRSTSLEVPEIGQALRTRYAEAQSASRTALNFEDWRTDAITQAAAAWVLSAVFVRFLEDNGLIPVPKISGPAGDKLKRARDEHELFFRSHPKLNDRDYLLSLFDSLTKHAATSEVFGPHNPLRELPQWLSGDAGTALIGFFQKIDANTGTLIHDFTDPALDTRFLGDRYHDLSEAARKKYALLQTPVFVEEFILDRTLSPALDEFGLAQPGYEARLEDDGRLNPADRFRMIDPACGSGHFLLGAFERLVQAWRSKEPNTNVRVLVQRALDSIHGVDLNPYAIAITRYRLLIRSLQSEGITRLIDAPAFHMNLACGDSLLHGAESGDQATMGWAPIDHVYQPEDRGMLWRLLQPGRYHAVVANPPYITPKDKNLNQHYRDRFSTCHMKYSLAVPFMQRIFNLATAGGHTGQITANSFMKREFGSKLIEQFFPRVDLTHVIDTSGAYIPGHGTPTVILFGRNRKPVGNTVRAVLGIKGEPSTPADPAHGLVWSSILRQIDKAGAQDDFTSTADVSRETLGRHPWSIGGGAAELKEQLEEGCKNKLGELADSIGITSFTLEDDIFLLPYESSLRYLIATEQRRVMVVGDVIRDWQTSQSDVCIFPYDNQYRPIDEDICNTSLKYLWLAKNCLANNKMFGGKTKVQCGLKWYEFGRLTSDKLRTPLSITFAFVASHNHFVLDRGGKVFNRSAPIIKLPADATEDDHLALLGVLNSSTACFWMQQTFHNKGGPGGGSSKDEKWHDFFEFSGTALQEFPIPEGRPLRLAQQLDSLASELGSLAPGRVIRAATQSSGYSFMLSQARSNMVTKHYQMLAIQEEIDWDCYKHYGLLEEDLCYTNAECPEVKPGERAFEIAMARKYQMGKLNTKWFDWLKIAPCTDIPSRWPDAYRELVQRRIPVIESNNNIRLIENSNCKRRWEPEAWEDQQQRALQSWLLDRLESYFDFDGRMNEAGTPTAQLSTGLTSVARLADIARTDAEFCAVGAVYRDDMAFDVTRLVSDLVTAESVPLLPVLRYKPPGLRKRAEWEQTWALQRKEDAIDAQGLPDADAEALKKQQVGNIPVPPKYTNTDFLKSDYWRLRGKLDVPKERWVSFPHCAANDGTLLIAWAGYNHLQLAQAISSYYVEVQENLGGGEDPRLAPLLACMSELLPWLKQWHNAVDPTFGVAMSDYFEGFVQEEARNLGQTQAEIREWQPPAKATKAKKKS